MRRLALGLLILPIALAILPAFLGSASSAQAGTPVQTAVANAGNLHLVVKAQSVGTTVRALARLTNRGTLPWRYLGGCAPPVLQIQAYDPAGNHLFGWSPHGSHCLALTLLSLLPGKSIVAHATLKIVTGMHVRAKVVFAHDMPRLQTPDIVILFPGTSPISWTAK